MNDATYYRWAEHRSFARLSDSQLDLIATYSPIVDVGTGNGYNPARLAERGADVVGIEPGETFHPQFDVIRGDHTLVGDYPDRTLLMVWPTKGDPWAADAVRRYAGSRVVYVGDRMYYETATTALPGVLAAGGFVKVHQEPVASWDWLVDVLQVWERKRPPGGGSPRGQYV